MTNLQPTVDFTKTRFYSPEFKLVKNNLLKFRVFKKKLNSFKFFFKSGFVFF